MIWMGSPYPEWSIHRIPEYFTYRLPASETDFRRGKYLPSRLVLKAGGPEPRKIRRDFHHSIRESPHPMIRMGSPYPESGRFHPVYHWINTANHGQI
jgi:hypothetical protein